MGFKRITTREEYNKILHLIDVVNCWSSKANDKCYNCMFDYESCPSLLSSNCPTKISNDNYLKIYKSGKTIKGNKIIR